MHKNIIDENGEYLAIGYDRKQYLMNHDRDRCNKHYRYCLD